MSGGAAGVAVGGNVRFAGHTPHPSRVRGGGGGGGGLGLGGGDGGLRGRRVMGTPHPASDGGGGGIGGGAAGGANPGVDEVGIDGNVDFNGGAGVGGSAPDDDDGFGFAPPPRASTMTGTGMRGGAPAGGVGRPPSSPSRATTDARTETVTANLPVVEPEDDVVSGVGEDLGRWVVVYGFPTAAATDDRDDAGGDDDGQLDVDTGLTEVASSVLRRFEGYGEVTGRRVASSRGGAKSGAGAGAGAVAVRPNWIALRYATVLQAEKALCQDGTGIGGGGARRGDSSSLMFVGVRRLDPSTARVLFGGASGRGGGSGRAVDVPRPPPPQTAPAPPRREAGATAATEEDVLLLRPAPGAGGDGRLPRGPLAMFLSWVFMW